MADRLDAMIDSVLSDNAEGPDRHDAMISAVLDGETPSDAPPSSGDPGNYEIGQRTNAFSGAAPSFRQLPTELPAPGANITRALLTNEPTQGFIEGATRAALPTIGGMIGGGAGLVGGAATGPGAVATTLAGFGLGGAAGEGVRQNLVQLRSAALGIPPSTPGEVAGRMGIEGVSQAAAGGVGMAAGPVLRSVGGGLVNNPIARAVGGYSDEASRTLLDRPSAVIAKIGDEGATAEAAHAFKGAIEENSRIAGESYRDIINQVVGDKSKYGPGFQLNVQSGIGDDLAQIMRDYGIGKPGRIGVEEASGNRFLEFFRRANELTSASADDVYYLQRDLNNAIRSAGDPTLKSALGQVKQSLSRYLETTVPEIGRANAIYSEAANLADDLSGVTNADDAARYIKTKLSGSGETKAAILAAADKLPQARKALEDLATARAAQAFTPQLAEIPRTGFIPGSVIAGKAFGVSPAGVAGAVAGAAGVSPRATAYTVRAVQGAAAGIPAGTFALPLSGESSALAEAYARRSLAPVMSAPMPAFAVNQADRQDAIARYYQRGLTPDPDNRMGYR